MTPVGLDLSLTSTGFSCGDRQLTFPSKLKGPARLIDIRSQFWQAIDGEVNPVVAIEGYSMASRNSQAHSTGELGGVIRVSLFEAGIPYVEIPPTCRAKFATGKGNAGKSEVVSSVSARTGITWSGKGADDMCDAWILEEALRWKLGCPRFDWPKTHTDGLSKVDWTSINQ